MMLVEQTSAPATALPVADFRDHLRLGTGFADDGAENSLLETFLRAAIAAVEAWTGKVLLERDFALSLMAWRDARMQTLPVAPVSEVRAIRIIDCLDWETIVDPSKCRLQQDTHRPVVMARGSRLPTIPPQGSVSIEFTAGFGESWANVPADLAQAVMLLAAYYYEYRHEMRVGAAVMPYGVSSLVDRWRNVRILGGGV
ncbi:putative phiE125 gp8 family phage protein [Aliiruegeria haliotis]|uniref:Putative phiE125 gp8 family phage protein n=1 Tax=Aliiruegeria haliotis TaxID=1280846 RepID=A0A2T0RYV2_9RHOB|nr:head-tail connector protein [Aliiruegeria haliotis]PRY26213.1 putative phiE125 gp8 family phage protein [Aliiruegeria haliotis]